MGGNAAGEVEILKQCEDLIKKDGFSLHKWHFYIPSLENTKKTSSNKLITNGKQMFQTSSDKTKLLGAPWSKLTDKISYQFVSHNFNKQ